MNEKGPKSLIIGFLTRIAATIIFGILNILGIIAVTLYLLITSWKTSDTEIGTMQYRLALIDDQKTNVILGPFMNQVFIADKSIKTVNGVRVIYGHQDDTISDITGRLQTIGNLSKHGERFVKVLDTVLGKDHSILSVPEEIKYLLTLKND